MQYVITECDYHFLDTYILSFADKWDFCLRDLRAPVLLYNEDATQHLFEVSAGLNSLVLGFS